MNYDKMNKKKKKQIVHYLAIKCAWLLILALGKLARIEVKRDSLHQKALKSGKPILYLVWHGKMLAPIYALRNHKIIAMVSEHGDGEIIARTILKLGYLTIRGSSTRGGQRAFREMLKALKNGHHCTVLPDGPQGPSQVMKMGAILLAQRSGGYLLPLTFAAQKPIRMKSWDRFTLWRPFSKVAVIYGEPLEIPRKQNPGQLEEYRLFVESRMNNLQAEADEIFRQ